MKSPEAFKASIEARLKQRVDAATGRDLHRLRVLMVMERFLVRIHHALPDSALLKGGLALELRLDQARTTKDIDLRVLGDPNDLPAQLQEAQTYRPQPEDHFQFVIAPNCACQSPNTAHPTVTGAGVKYDGFRFKVSATLAGKRYVTFGLDVAYGDPVLDDPELLEGSDFFEPYGIPPCMIRTYPATTHLAEKLHAYTLPRTRVNMRMKDLIDMPLIGLALDGRAATSLRDAFKLTFNFRDSHLLPEELARPPREWLGPYDRLRVEESLPWPTLADLHAAAAGLIDPVLAGVEGTWSAADVRWSVESP